MKIECLEVLNDLLRRFASALAEGEAREALDALFAELSSARAAARAPARRAIVAAFVEVSTGFNVEVSTGLRGAGIGSDAGAATGRCIHGLSVRRPSVSSSDKASSSSSMTDDRPSSVLRFFGGDS